ncbi:MAG: L,D-transpeptidase family protein [Sphingosinicella sp.]|uniref:L,D-transpeptidase family protein n=1 Tax=Sphingosinicella sp. TaxID=1917971 RepID=UPI00403773CA
MKLAPFWSAASAAIVLTLAAAPAASSEHTDAAIGLPVPAVQALDAVSAPVAAPVAAVAPAPAPVVRRAFYDADEQPLAPGAFVWRPELATAGPVEMVVSIPLQRAYVYRGGVLIGVTTVSTGRPGHATPTGSFPILEKRREHYSNLYNNAPMPFMQRLTWDGIALHAGQIPGRPASHGCVRLPLEFARLLFAATRVGGEVHIVDSAPTAETALAEVRGPTEIGVEMTLASLR